MRAFFGICLLAWISISIEATCKNDACTAACKTNRIGDSSKPNAILANDLLNSTTFEAWFPKHDPNYKHDELLKAISLFPEFCNGTDICKKHLSFVLAHARQETGCLESVGENITHAITDSYGGGECYKGRGLLQLTGNNNYEQFSLWYYGEGNGCCLVDDPEKVAEENLAILSGIWAFSSDKLMNSIEDDDFGDTTKAINGNQECGCIGVGCLNHTGHPDGKHMDAPKCRFKYFQFYASEFGYSDEVWKHGDKTRSTDCTEAGGNQQCKPTDTGCEAKKCGCENCKPEDTECVNGEKWCLVGNVKHCFE